MINRRFVETAVWCREIALPVAVVAVLVTASSPASDVYSLATADVAPVVDEQPATDAANAAPDVPLSSDSKTHEAQASEAQASEPRSSEPVTTAAISLVPAALSLASAALDMPAAELPKSSADAIAQPDNFSGPKTDEITDAVSSIEINDECLVMEMCADRFLWQLYERTRKEDTIRETTYRKVTIKKKKKWITVTRATSISVDEDFGWKDPKAAKNVGMPLTEYVIGGVDRNFRLRLFSMLRAADQAGLGPGITSGFRDDYRQSIASGLKAASNRSYHGGSLRGGYGHGLAADIVSVKGATRAERLSNSNVLWKWVDDHGIEFGIGRPYLDRDPPHVGPIDGEEFAHHRPGVASKTRQAAAAN